MNGVRYRELRLPAAEDPLSLMVRLARSGLFEEYVVYENGPEWSFAGGVLADLRLDAEACRTAGPTVVESWLAELPVRGWRAYGWTAFEWGAVLAGAGSTENTAGTDGEADAGVLVHLAVPVGEVRADGDGVLVRAVDERQLALLARLVRAAPGSPPREPAERVEVRLDDTGDYREAVTAALSVLRASASRREPALPHTPGPVESGPLKSGPLEKVILSRQVPVPVPLDLTATYLAGRRANTPARSFLVRLGQAHAAGFSPETVAEVTADRRVVSRPLAGTRARTGVPAEDARLRAELLSDPKEIHEHAISVKLALEDLAAVCGETWVAEYLTVQDRGTVQHLASTVMGRLRADRTPWQAFAALFPAVTATGIPKAPAYPLIRRLEGRPRGLYAGAVLTYDTDGTLDAALVLRTVFQQDGRNRLQAGAGIVRQSRPDREHEETCEKLRSVAAHLVPLTPTTAATPAPSSLPAKIPAQEEGASDTVAP